jgi:hypothetical protein
MKANYRKLLGVLWVLGVPRDLLVGKNSIGRDIGRLEAEIKNQLKTLDCDFKLVTETCHRSIFS